jgi:hypothetical protein
MQLRADQLARLSKLAASCNLDPLRWAETAFPWGVAGTPLEKEQLRDWQFDVLDLIAFKLADKKTRFHPIRVSIASGHGIGKSATMSIVANWAMTCWRNPRIVVTANTDGQLRTKTSPEFAKWFRLSVSAPLFDIDTTRISLNDPSKRDGWRLDFIPWSETNPEAFAGLHNKGNIIIVMMDEGSAISDTIWETIEGALTDEDTVIIWLVFGNPTRNTGRFRECFRRFRHLWSTFQIDASKVEGTNHELHKEWAETYGIDSDFYKVRVSGQFPSSSDRQFIPTNLVDAAFGKHLEKHQYDFAPSIVTCDPAWSGADELVIGHRKGLFFEVLETTAKNNNDVLVAQKLMAYQDKHNAVMVNIDAGYGTGIYSAGVTFGRTNWNLVWFSGAALDKGILNKRTEMYMAVRRWLTEGGAIPKDQVLYENLIAPETLPRNDGKVALEGKEDMKKRKLPSPGRSDALALSFAFPVLTKHHDTGHGDKPVVLNEEYNPHGSS